MVAIERSGLVAVMVAQWWEFSLRMRNGGYLVHE